MVDSEQKAEGSKVGSDGSSWVLPLGVVNIYYEDHNNGKLTLMYL